MQLILTFFMKCKFERSFIDTLVGVLFDFSRDDPVNTFRLFDDDVPSPVLCCSPGTVLAFSPLPQPLQLPVLQWLRGRRGWTEPVPEGAAGASHEDVCREYENCGTILSTHLSCGITFDIMIPDFKLDSSFCVMLMESFVLFWFFSSSCPVSWTESFAVWNWQS